MRDCKGCNHSDVLYTRDRDGRYSNAYVASGYIVCGKPSYKKGRSYVCKDTRKACGEYAPRERSTQ